MKCDLAAVVQKSPAQVDVVAGRREDRVEAVELDERVPPEGHIAARYVFGSVVVEQHVRGPARRLRNALGGQTVVRWSDVGSATAGRRRPIESQREEMRPLGCRVRIAIEVGDDLVARGANARVACRR